MAKTLWSFGLSECNRVKFSFCVIIKYVHLEHVLGHIQLTLVISKSKGPSKTLRDIRSSTFRFIVLRKKIFKQPNFTNDYVI